MEYLQQLTLELYQILFIASILYVLYGIITFGLTLYNMFILEDIESRYVLTPKRQSYILISITIILSFLIN